MRILVVLVVCDLHVNLEKGKCLLIDLEPWCRHRTDSIIFSWDELERIAYGEAQFRVVDSEAQCSYSRAKTLLGPVELENMSAFDPARIFDQNLQH